jgi:hypothetical protein
MPVLRLPQHEIDGPATAHVLARFPTVEQEVGVRAAGFFERIREDWQAVEAAILIDGIGDGDSGRGEPCGIGDDGSERIVTNYVEANLSNKFHIRKRKRLDILGSSSISTNHHESCEPSERVPTSCHQWNRRRSIICNLGRILFCRTTIKMADLCRFPEWKQLIGSDESVGTPSASLTAFRHGSSNQGHSFRQYPTATSRNFRSNALAGANGRNNPAVQSCPTGAILHSSHSSSIIAAPTCLRIAVSAAYQHPHPRTRPRCPNPTPPSRS